MVDLGRILSSMQDIRMTDVSLRIKEPIDVYEKLLGKKR